MAENQTDFKAQVEKLRPTNQFSHMYFLTEEMGNPTTSSAKKVELPEVADYLASLNQATSDWNTAVNTERDKKAAFDAATADLTQAQKDLTATNTNRRQTTFNNVVEG